MLLPCDCHVIAMLLPCATADVLRATFDGDDTDDDDIDGDGDSDGDI